MKVWTAVALGLVLAAPSYGQVVQLPAVGSFGVSTTVSVPDQGTASLGGVGRSSSGTTSRGFGPLANAARGSHSGMTSASVSATIIDLAAMDEAILNAAADAQSNIAPNHAPRKPGTKIVNTLTPHYYDRVMTRRAAPPAPHDWMRALGPQNEPDASSAEGRIADGSNVRFFMSKAAEAQALGRNAAARVYYAMALERMTPAQRLRLDEVLAARTAKPNEKAKDPTDTTKPAASADAPVAQPSSPADPFAPPAGEAGTNTDMTSSPF